MDYWTRSPKMINMLYNIWIMLIIQVLPRFVSNSLVVMDAFQVNEFEASAEINEFTLDIRSGSIYACAQNKLYQLAKDLSQMAVVTHGSSGTLCKILLIEKTSDRLISCWTGSTHGARCQGERLGNISATDTLPNTEPIVLMEASMSILAFIGIIADNRATPSLFIGKSYQTQSHMLIRSLYNFGRINTNDSNVTAIINSVTNQNILNSRFLLGFSFGQYNYFVKIVESKEYKQGVLQRTCNRDKSFMSSAQLPLSCSSGGSTFTTISAAHFNPKNAVLYVAFHNNFQGKHTSVICHFQTDAINMKISHTINKCFHNLSLEQIYDHRGVYDTSEVRCWLCHPSEICWKDSCNVSQIYPRGPVAGLDPVRHTAIKALPNIHVTSIVTTNRHPGYIFVGTMDGQVIKVQLDNDSFRVSERDVSLIGRQEPINRNMFFDEDGAHLYVMAGRHIYRLSTSCLSLTTCERCTSSPQLSPIVCGWCVHQERCSSMVDCKSRYPEARWLTEKNTCQNFMTTALVKTVTNQEFYSHHSMPQISKTMTTENTLSVTEMHDNDHKVSSDASNTKGSALLGVEVISITSSVLVISVLLLVFGIFCIQHKVQRSRNNVIRLSTLRETLEGPLADHSLMSKLQPRVRHRIKEIVKPAERLQIDTENPFAEGNFGCVYRGTFTDDDGIGCSVAVKTLKHSTTAMTLIEDFLEEATIMKDLDHNHVLHLLGVVLGEKLPYVILPIAHYGDLRSHIANCRSAFIVEQLLDMGRQVAEGMMYLSNHAVIHRDLAARNCLVTADNVVKISDFGLSRDLHGKDYYKMQTQDRPLPVKWMAIESLKNFVFTVKSDVWAYGVLLWEVLMRGATPYADVAPQRILCILERGTRLHKPPAADDEMYTLMMDCWKVEPLERPTFENVAERLGAILSDEAT